VFDLGEHVGLLSLGIFVIDLFDETGFFQLGQNAVIDEIIGVDSNSFNNWVDEVQTGMRSELTNRLQENFIASPAGEVKLTFAIDQCL
jgi:hypothetical protein